MRPYPAIKDANLLVVAYLTYLSQETEPKGPQSGAPPKVKVDGKHPQPPITLADRPIHKHAVLKYITAAGPRFGRRQSKEEGGKEAVRNWQRQQTLIKLKSQEPRSRKVQSKVPADSTGGEKTVQEKGAVTQLRHNRSAPFKPGKGLKRDNRSTHNPTKELR